MSLPLFSFRVAVLCAAFSAVASSLYAQTSTPVCASVTTGGKNASILCSAFLVDSRGYFATSFHGLQGANSVSIQLAGGKSLLATSFIAASRGHDIVILRVAGLPPEITSGSFFFAPTPKEGQTLVALSGPLSKPVQLPIALGTPIVCQPKLARQVRGDLFSLMAPASKEELAGMDADTRWLVLDQFRERNFAGGPVVDPQMQVVGMLSSAVMFRNTVFAAIDSQHLIDLLARPLDRPQPLSALQTWQDPVHPVGTLSGKDAEKTYSGRLLHGKNLTTRMQNLQDRTLLLEIGEIELDKAIKARKADAAQKLASVEKLRTRFNGIRPEETREVIAQVRRSDLDPTSDRSVVFDRAMRTEVVFSARQQAERAKLRESASLLSVEVTHAQISDSYQKQVEVPAYALLKERLRTEWLFLLDPFEIRTASERLALEEELNQLISEGGAPGTLYAARAFLKAQSEDFAAAKSDLKEAKQIDPKLAPMLTAIDAYRLHMQGETKESNKLLSQISTAAKSDVWVQILSAAIQFRQSEDDEALKLLQKARLSGADPLEIDFISAWIYGTNSSLSKAKPKAGLAHAHRAVSATGRCDWLSLAALAACHARLGEFDRATEIMTLAHSIAPATDLPRCEAWQATILSSNPITLQEAVE